MTDAIRNEYWDLEGNHTMVPELEWLEDKGVFSRYSTGDEESVWLDEDFNEVEVD